jgi:hypothetical protein
MKFTSIGYSIKKTASSPDYPFFERVAFIWVSSGEGEFCEARQTAGDSSPGLLPP